MKKYYLLGISCCLASMAFAQNDFVTPQEEPEMVAQRVSRNGYVVAGQDALGSVVYGYYPAYQEREEYSPCILGNGNCVANNGIIVGQYSGTALQACIMWNGEVKVPSYFNTDTQSALDGITPDGRRACGYISQSSGVMFVPIIVDIDANGNVGRPIRLPYPRKDFFGDTPQWITAIAISDDGKTIVGSVQDGSGFYNYPIVFIEDAEGNWTYTEPTAPLFNPNKLPLPKYPDDISGNDVPKQPVITDYMTPQEIAKWKEAQKENPNANPATYISDEGNRKFNEAIKEYYDKVNELLGEKFDEYWHQMYLVGKDEQFVANTYALSPDGSKFVATKGYNDDPNEMTGDVMSYYVPYIFDLKEGTFTPTQRIPGVNLIANQMLKDGTVIAISNQSDFVPFVGYMLLPGETEFIKFTEFLYERIPSYLPWLEDSELTQYGVIGYDQQGQPIYGEYTITGYISISDDYKVVAGGYPLGEGYSYIYYTKEGVDVTGVEEITLDPTMQPEVYEVYNLNGVKVLSTPDYNAVKGLQKGIYIVNGRKVVIN